MTIGISKERLFEKLSDLADCSDIKSHEKRDYLKTLILDCTELNPWLPIEQAPKDRRILAWNVIEGVYETQCHHSPGTRDEWPHHKFVYPSKGDLELCPDIQPRLVTNWPQPTHYQELPGDPE